ncbi:aspartate dehydrogenase [Mediterraneibacter glycyrrhizinilyticus]|nr:aspartate dehydrogenase [Mediterraneibacter glycyrrhizinilyticus]MBM6854352.1 aspartate dehydrogenase [Mediterraneibacter glycyrrhizinilyticus]
MFSGFLKKKKAASTHYDPALKRPALRCSICTGEQVAGFRRLEDGKFEEVMLIRSDADLQSFRDQYGITGDIEKIY